MPDRIDPGPGWRLLKLREKKRAGDEYFDGWWRPTTHVGDPIDDSSCPVRRRLGPRTTKAIATRATVICGTMDGARTTNTISRESGLTESDEARVVEAWRLIQEVQTKYVMLEIHRGGEP